MNVDKLFSQEARGRIAAAVARAEALSRGQLVPVVVARSDGYQAVHHRAALLAAALATVVVVALDLPVTLLELALLQLAAGLLGSLVSAWPPLERRLIGRRAMAEAVRLRALRAFHEEGLHRTAEGTGVLVFASLLERRAVILGDHGIHARMQDAGWEEAVGVLTEGLRAGTPERGFVEAIARCGARLAEHFPRTPGQPPPANELEDAIRVSPE
jgi:putative membrane protein